MFSDPKIWLAVSFLIFISLLIKYIAPKLIAAIDNKSKQIADDIDKAEQMRKDAENLLVAAQKYHQESVEYSQKLISDSTKESEKLLTESKKSLEVEVAKKIDLAKERIRQEEEKIVREIRSNIIKAAVKAIEIKASNLSSKSAEDINKKSIFDISKTIH